MFALMLFMLFFILGFSVWMLYLLKRMDSQFRQLADEHAQLRVLMRALESRLDNILKVEEHEAANVETNAEDISDSAHDSLLHLSFEQPSKAPAGSGLDINLNLDPPKS